MRPLVDIQNARPWREMTREEQQLVAHQLDKQMSSIASQLALDVTAGLIKSGVPLHMEVTYKLVWDPGKDPRHDG